MRRLAVILICGVLLGCETKPHHQTPPPELIASLTSAVDACIAQAGITPEQLPSEREMARQIQLLAMHAQDSYAEIDLFDRERWDEAVLRAQAERSIEHLYERRGYELHDEHLLRILLATPPPLERDRVVLLIAISRQMRVEHRLPQPPLPDQ